MKEKKNRAWYDPEVDILSLVKPKKARYSEDVDDIVVDIGFDGFVTGVEILDASRKLDLTEEQLCSLKEADIQVNYKQNKVYLILTFLFEKVRKEVRIPVTIDLGRNYHQREQARFSV